MLNNVFISYSSDDQEIAFSICEMIEQNGIKCWIAPRDVVGGRTYGAEIVDAINNSNLVLLIFSHNSNKSNHVANEVDIAFNEGKIIIPFRISQTTISSELKYYLNNKHWIDGYPSPKDKFNLLLKSIQNNLPEYVAQKDKQEAIHIIYNILEDKDNLDNNKDFLLTLEQKIYDAIQLSNKDIIKTSNKSYNILKNDDGEILIKISPRKGVPCNPRFVYDGGERALLYRNKESALFLNNIGEEARKPLTEVTIIHIEETFKEDEILREYDVPVMIVPDLGILWR